MTISVPEYVLLFGIGVLNIWAAVILAGIRARSLQEDNRPMPLEQPARPETPRTVGAQPIHPAIG